MGKKKLIQAVSLALTVLLCLCGSSCTRTGREEPTSQQRLTVEQTPTSYTPDFSASAAEQGAELVHRLLSLCGGPVLNESQKQVLKNQIKEQILPHLEDLSVYPYELTALFEKTKQLCTLWEENHETTPSNLFLGFYQTGLSVMPSQKLGSIIFTFTDLYLNHKTQQSYERYDTYGYQWYLEDAHHYSDLLTQLHSTLGEETFSQMVTLAVFALSLGGGAAPQESRLFTLSDEELTVLLRRQADYFCSAEISQEQWGSAAQIYSTLFTPQGNSLTDAALSALFRSGYVGQLSQCMPAFLTLYRALTQVVTPQQLSALRSGVQEEAALTAARLLSSVPAEFLALEQQLNQYGYSQSVEEEGALHSAGLWEEYQQYLESTPTVQAQQLLERAVAYADAPEQESKDAFLNSVQQYLRTYLPCLAFVLSHSQV